MSDWRRERIKAELEEVGGFREENLSELEKYDNKTQRAVLSVVIKWACYPQNIAGIMLGRELFGRIPKKVTENHLISVLKNDFEFDDYWNFLRLIEAVSEYAPEMKSEILILNEGSTDPDIVEIINDYS